MNNNNINNSSVNIDHEKSSLIKSSVTNSSSIKVSETISSVDIDRDNCIVNHISSSLDETPGNYV